MVKRFHARNGSWPSRLGWFVLIWAASVAALAGAALILRTIMSVAGLTTG